MPIVSSSKTNHLCLKKLRSLWSFEFNSQFDPIVLHGVLTSPSQHRYHPPISRASKHLPARNDSLSASRH